MCKRLMIVGALTASMLCSAGGAFAQKIEDTGDFVLQMKKPKDEAMQTIRKLMDERGRFEFLINVLNAFLALPEDITVTFREGDAGDAYYDSSAKQIVISYQFVELIYRLFAENEYIDPESEEDFDHVISVAEGVLLHEAGHALIDTLNIPVVGREEDAVDALSTLLMLAVQEKPELLMAQPAFWNFLGEARSTIEDEDFQDEHGLHEQRYYNILCWIYGSDPKKFAEYADDWGLGEGRAERCPDEFTKLNDSWDALLLPYEKELEEGSDADEKASDEESAEQETETGDTETGWGSAIHDAADE